MLADASCSEQAARRLAFAVNQSSVYLARRVPAVTGDEAGGLAMKSFAGLFRGRIGSVGIALPDSVSGPQRGSASLKCQTFAGADRAGQETEASGFQSYRLERKRTAAVENGGSRRKSTWQFAGYLRMDHVTTSLCLCLTRVGTVTLNHCSRGAG